MWLLALLGVILLGAIGFLGVQLLGEPVGRRRAQSIALVTVPDCDDVALTTLRSETDELGLCR